MTFKYPILKEVAPAMSSPSSTPIPAGWYPDPAGSFQQRWWTGESWTNDFAQYRPTLVHSAPVVETVVNPAPQQQAASSASYLSQQAAATMSASVGATAQQAGYGPTQTLTRQTFVPEQPAVVDPLPVFRLPDDDQPPQTVVAQPNAGNATLIAVAPTYRTPSLNADFSTDYQPFSTVGPARAGVRLNPDRRYTAWAWLLALLPAALGGAAFALATLVPVLYTTFTQVLLVVVFLLLAVGLAALDRHVLYRDGHDRLASPALALLTPLAYLPARAAYVGRETARNALAPLIVLLVVVAGIAAALVLVNGLLSLLLTASALY